MPSAQDNQQPLDLKDHLGGNFLNLHQELKKHDAKKIKEALDKLSVQQLQKLAQNIEHGFTRDYILERKIKQVEESGILQNHSLITPELRTQLYGYNDLKKAHDELMLNFIPLVTAAQEKQAGHVTTQLSF